GFPSALTLFGICTVPSVRLPSGAAGAGSVSGCCLGAVWPSFAVCPPLRDDCAKAVLAAARAPTRAPTKTVRFIPGLRSNLSTAELKLVQLYRPLAIGVPARKPAQRLVMTISPLN